MAVEFFENQPDNIVNGWILIGISHASYVNGSFK